MDASRNVRVANTGTFPTQLNASQSNTAGTITTSSSTVTTTDLVGVGAVTVQISGTYAGVNLTFEVTLDGVIWVGISGQQVNALGAFDYIS